MLYANFIPNLINTAMIENRIDAEIAVCFIVTSVSRDRRCVGKIWDVPTHYLILATPTLVLNFRVST